MLASQRWRCSQARGFAWLAWAFSSRASAVDTRASRLVARPWGFCRRPRPIRLQVSGIFLRGTRRFRLARHFGWLKSASVLLLRNTDLLATSFLLLRIPPIAAREEPRGAREQSGAPRGGGFCCSAGAFCGSRATRNDSRGPRGSCSRNYWLLGRESELLTRESELLGRDSAGVGRAFEAPAGGARRGAPCRAGYAALVWGNSNFLFEAFLARVTRRAPIGDARPAGVATPAQRPEVSLLLRRRPRRTAIVSRSASRPAPLPSTRATP